MKFHNRGFALTTWCIGPCWGNWVQNRRARTSTWGLGGAPLGPVGSSIKNNNRQIFLGATWFLPSAHGRWLDGSCDAALQNCVTHFHYPNLFLCYSLFCPGTTDQNVRTRRWNEHIQRSQWRPRLGPSERSAQSWSDCLMTHPQRQDRWSPKQTRQRTSHFFLLLWFI